MDDAVFYRPDGNMLLHGGVGGAGNDLAHRLAAADERAAALLNQAYEIAAMLAKIKLLIIHHNSPFCHT